MQIKAKIFICLFISSLVVGCSSRSSYHAYSKFESFWYGGPSSGYLDVQVGSDEFMIDYTGVPGGSLLMAERYAFYRAAELGKEKHYNFFKAVVKETYGGSKNLNMPEVVLKVKYYRDKPLGEKVTDTNKYLAENSLSAQELS